jgi:dihydroxyacetone kinase
MWSLWDFVGPLLETCVTDVTGSHGWSLTGPSMMLTSDRSDPGSMTTLSVGGSGHKTTHAGFVREGILSAEIGGKYSLLLMWGQIRKAINSVRDDNR